MERIRRPQRKAHTCRSLLPPPTTLHHQPPRSARPTCPQMNPPRKKTTAVAPPYHHEDQRPAGRRTTAPPRTTTRTPTSTAPLYPPPEQPPDHPRPNLGPPRPQRGCHDAGRTPALLPLPPPCRSHGGGCQSPATSMASRHASRRDRRGHSGGGGVCEGGVRGEGCAGGRTKKDHLSPTPPRAPAPRR